MKEYCGSCGEELPDTTGPAHICRQVRVPLRGTIDVNDKTYSPLIDDLDVNNPPQGSGVPTIDQLPPSIRLRRAFYAGVDYWNWENRLIDYGAVEQAFRNWSETEYPNGIY
jgi:hypothetical protein